jgi:hypothetical protein
MVRAPGIAPGTADWQTAALLLRHARNKLGPCRPWAAGWLPRRSDGAVRFSSLGSTAGAGSSQFVPQGNVSSTDRLRRLRSENLHARPAVPLNVPLGRTAHVGAGPRQASRLILQKEHTPSSLSPRVGRIGRPRDLMRALADWLGSVVKPRGNLETGLGPRLPEAAFRA